MNGEAATILGNTYANAIFDLAKDSRLVDGVRNDFQMLAQLIDSEKDFMTLNESPYFLPDFKSTVIRKMLAGRVGDLTLDFLMIVARRNRLAFLPWIIEAYEKLWDEYNGIMPVKVTLASNADAAEIEAIKTQVAEAINKKVKLAVAVNPAILGGIVIRCGDMVIDNSIHGRLVRAVRSIIDRNGKAQI